MVCFVRQRCCCVFGGQKGIVYALIIGLFHIEKGDMVYNVYLCHLSFIVVCSRFFIWGGALPKRKPPIFKTIERMTKTKSQTHASS